MGIFNLPKPGNKFKTKNSLGSFNDKLSSITRMGNLKNLQNNIPAIIEAVKSYEKYIQRGGLSSWQKLSVLKKIKEKDKNLTNEDIREIKQIINNLGK